MSVKKRKSKKGVTSARAKAADTPVPQMFGDDVRLGDRCEVTAYELFTDLGRAINRLASRTSLNLGVSVNSFRILVEETAELDYMVEWEVVEAIRRIIADARETEDREGESVRKIVREIVAKTSAIAEALGFRVDESGNVALTEGHCPSVEKADLQQLQRCVRRVLRALSNHVSPV